MSEHIRTRCKHAPHSAAPASAVARWPAARGATAAAPLPRRRLVGTGVQTRVDALLLRAGSSAVPVIASLQLHCCCKQGPTDSNGCLHVAMLPLRAGTLHFQCLREDVSSAATQPGSCTARPGKNRTSQIQDEDIRNPGLSRI
eukprot:1139322-Pelagomonas_calceolata.AAC.4